MTDQEILDFVNECHAKEISQGFTSLDGFEKTVTCVSWVSFEVDNGGFSGFFYNSAGDNANETVDALTLIGANEAAKALEDAIRCFPNLENVPQRDYRQDHIVSLTEKFRRLEKEFYNQDPVPWDLLFAYVRKHFET